MTRTYVQRKPAQRQEAPKQRPTDPAQGSLTAFGADLSSSGASAHPVDLPGAIREKFENAFGADLSSVRFYRSQAVKDAGAQAVARHFGAERGRGVRVGLDVAVVVGRRRGPDFGRRGRRVLAAQDQL